MNGADDHGERLFNVTPPVDAVAALTIDGTVVSRCGVRADHEVAVYAADRVPDDGRAPFPPSGDRDDSDADAAREVTLSEDAWVTMAVGGYRVCRVTAATGETVAVGMEADT